MSIHTYSSRDFTRDVGAAKRAAGEGPVFITSRGRPAFALLKIEDYYHLAGHKEASLVEVMDAIRIAANFSPEYEIEFDPPRLELEPRPVEFE